MPPKRPSQSPSLRKRLKSRSLDVPDGRLEHLIGHVIEIDTKPPETPPVRFRVEAVRTSDLAIAGPIINGSSPDPGGILYAASLVKLGSAVVAVFLNARDVTDEYWRPLG